MEDNCLFSKSCLNLSLKKSNYFISAFPARLVFGQCSSIGYNKSQYFEFELFQLCSLYFVIFDIVNSFVQNKNVGLFDNKNSEKSEFDQLNYFNVNMAPSFHCNLKTIFLPEDRTRVLKICLQLDVK